MASAIPTPPAASDTRRVRAALMNKVCGDEDMFALGTSVARVVQMASSDDQGAHDLAYYVLSDVALTQRILRLSNTAHLPHRVRHRRHHHLARHFAARLRQRQDHRAGDAAGRCAVQQRACAKRAGRAGSVAVRQPGRARNGAPQLLPGRRGSVDRRAVQEPRAAAGGLARARALPRDQRAGRRPASTRSARPRR